MDPHNPDALASREALDYWSPIDWYNGGMEHTTLHLLYSRFWHKFLYDIGVVPTAEPYGKRTSHGMILGFNPHNFQNLPEEEQKRMLAEFGSEKAAQAALVEKYGEMADHPIVKMSKSLNNVINPDDIVEEYGADTMRLYEMFVGDFEKAAPWSTAGVKGCRRLIDRYWNLRENLIDSEELRPALESAFHKTIKKVTEDTETLKFNTAIAALMALMNEIGGQEGVTRGELRLYTLLLNPFAPHITEEVWAQCVLGEGMACQQPWPRYDEAKCKDSTVEIVVQIKGKVRARINVPADISKEDAIAAAKAEEKIAAETAGKDIVKEIYVPGKLVNLVTK